MNKFKHSQPLILLAMSIMLLTACGGGDGVGVSNTPTSGITDPVATSLQAFGVDTSQTSRIDNDQDPLPSSYSPLGNVKTFNKTDELLLLGFGLNPSSFGALPEHKMSIVKAVPDKINNIDTLSSEPQFIAEQINTPWALATANQYRAATNADIDGDGIEEIVITYKPTEEDAVYLVTYSTKDNALSISEPLLISNMAVTDLGIAAGDFDGDGMTDVVVIETHTSAARLVMLKNQSGNLVLSGKEILLSQTVTNSTLHIAIDVGNIDYDAADEIALVVNERYLRNTFEHGAHSYLTYDDSLNNFKQLNSGSLSTVVDLAAEGKVGLGTRTALTADVSIGDVDADGVGEIVFAGLTTFATDGSCNYYYLTQVLDDAKHNQVQLAAQYQRVINSNAADCSGLQLRHVHVNTLNVDNDIAAEIQVNQYGYDDLANGAASLVRIHTINPSLLFTRVLNNTENSYSGRFDVDNTAMDTGDINQDYREDVVFFSPSQNDVYMWWGTSNEPGRINTNVTNSDQLRPIIVTANIDNDSPVLKYKGATTEVDSAYKLVFTEPVIIAVLAAPPCSAELGQDVSVCKTSFGTSTTNNSETEQTWHYSAGVSAGFSYGTDFGGFIFAAEAIISRVENYSSVHTSSYSLTKSVTYTTGGNTDSVIFATIPYDQYTYTILSHPESELIGKEIVISLPRNPITILTTREFYNANIHADGVRIDSSILSHTTGQPQSYPTAAQKNLRLTSPNAYASDLKDVGQGPGDSQAHLEISKETTTGESRGYEWTTDISTTLASVVVGLTVGEGADKKISIGYGTSTFYSGTVSDINSNDFSNTYSYGLFTYLHTPASHPEMQFEVINYWVE